ncbi:MAG: DUF3592 domain-containing protein [Stenotrophomonas sp.]
MISIPVPPSSHRRLATVSKWLCLAAYVVVVLVFSLSGLDNYRKSSAILKDHAVVSAPVELDSVEENRGRKGRVSHQYHFNYAFEAGGVTHHGSFTTSEGNASPYLDEGATVQIAYSRSEPARFERLSLLENNKSLGSVLTRLCIGLILMALLAFVVHLLITCKLFVARPEATAQ